MHNEPPVAAEVRVDDELRQEIYRYTDTDAPMLDIATRALLEIERLRKVIALKNGIIDQYVPCADHRDKHDGTCYMCAAERGRADTTRLDHLRTHGLINAAGRQGRCFLPERMATLDALREAIDDDIECEASYSRPSDAVAP